MENKMSDEKDKRKQHCTACRNHDQKERKTSHKCPFERCECLLCQLTQTSRTIMRHQQRLWRHLKDKNPSIEQHSKKQVCDKCRNHGTMVSKRNHKGSCPRETCTCELCGLTNNRRDIMRHQQRVRRSATVTSTEHQDAYEYVQKTKMDLKQKFGDIDVPDITDGYSSPEDDRPSSPKENRLFAQDGTKKQFIERYRQEEIATKVPWEDDSSPLSYQSQPEYSSPQSQTSTNNWYENTVTSEGATSKNLALQRVKSEPEYSSLQSQASTNNWYDNTVASEGASSKKLALQRVKEEIIYSTSNETTHDHPELSRGLSPQHGRHVFNPVAKRTRYGVPVDDYNLSQSLPSYQLRPRIIPMDGLMCAQIGPRMSSYPLNLLSMPRQTQPFMLNYTHPFNRTQHPLIRPQFHPHP